MDTVRMLAVVLCGSQLFQAITVRASGPTPKMDFVFVCKCPFFPPLSFSGFAAAYA